MLVAHQAAGSCDPGHSGSANPVAGFSDELSTGHRLKATPIEGMTAVSRLRAAAQTMPQIPAGLSTFLARACLGGFVLFLLALASNS